MSRAYWKIVGSKLVIINSKGVEYLPSAHEIYAAVFKDSLYIDQEKIDQPTFDKEIRFSRFPLDIFIEVRGQIFTEITFHICVEVNNATFFVDRDEDYIIIEGTWFPLRSEENLEILQNLEKYNIDISKTNQITLHQFYQIKNDDELSKILVSRVENNINPLPESSIQVKGLNATLYSYQETGVSYLYMLSTQDLGCLLGDEMGLGKTIQAIALLLIEKERKASPSLIVCPSSLLSNWQREINTFSPTLSALVHSGQNRTGVSSTFLNFDLIITSYDILSRDVTLFLNLKWNIIFADEAQYIKTPNTERTLAIKALNRRIGIAITGTPVENKLMDLWSIFDFIIPGIMGTSNSFQAKYEDTEENAAKLGIEISPFLLRRKVIDVAKDLPAKIEIPQEIDLNEELIEHYENVRRRAIAEYGKSGSLVALIRLRQFCAHPLLLGQNISLSEFSKFFRCLELLEEISYSNQKVIIFTSFQGMIDLMIHHFKNTFQSNTYIDFIDGRVESCQRQEVIDNFFKSRGFSILLLNPKAAGAGLNITAANHVIHYNPEWNPAITDQASARAYRRKQTLPVSIHYLYIAQTIENVIIDRSLFKRTLADLSTIGNEGDSDPIFIQHALNITPKKKYEDF